MKCPLNQDYLQLFIDDELETLERLVLEEHLWGCKDCMRTLNQFKVLDWDLKRLPEPQLPKELETLRERVIAELTEPVPRVVSSPAFIQSQYSNLSHTVKFTNYLPGSKLLNKYTATGYQLAARKGKEQVLKFFKKIIGI